MRIHQGCITSILQFYMCKHLVMHNILPRTIRTTIEIGKKNKFDLKQDKGHGIFVASLQNSGKSLNLTIFTLPNRPIRRLTDDNAASQWWDCNFLLQNDCSKLDFVKQRRENFVLLLVTMKGLRWVVLSFFLNSSIFFFILNKNFVSH